MRNMPINVLRIPPARSARCIPLTKFYTIEKGHLSSGGCGFWNHLLNFFFLIKDAFVIF